MGGANKVSVVALLYAGSVVGGLRRLLLFLPPETRGAQAHLLWGSQVQTDFVPALAIPRLSFAPLFDRAAPVTMSGKNLVSCTYTLEYQTLLTLS